jgi:hypothetical protein
MTRLNVDPQDFSLFLRILGLLTGSAPDECGPGILLDELIGPDDGPYGATSDADRWALEPWPARFA